MTHLSRRCAAVLTLLVALFAAAPAHAQKAAAGGAHAVVLTGNGAVWTWGLNFYGQLGRGNNTDSWVPIEVLSISGVTAIAAGGDSTYALKSDGTVWAWGRNAGGQLGDGSTSNQNTPVRVGTLTNVVAIAAGTAHGLALKGDGTLWAWGSNASGELGDGTQTQRTSPVQVTSLGTSVVAIAAADSHSHASENCQHEQKLCADANAATNCRTLY